MADLEEECEDDFEDDDFGDQMLAIRDENTPDFQMFRPGLSDQQKVGFFSSDRATQTDHSDIIDLKEMTEVLQTLLQDVNQLKKDIAFAKHVIQADYEKKLQSKAIDLYCRVNDRVAELEKVHLDRVQVVRRAFRQQLADAIARVQVLTDKSFSQRLDAEGKSKAKKVVELEGKVVEMQSTIQRNESLIHMLKMQLSQQASQEDLEEAEEDLTGRVSKTPSINYEAEEQRELVQKLEKKVEKLKQALADKEDSTSKSSKEIEKLQSALEKERVIIEQLKQEREEMVEAAEQERVTARRMSKAWGANRIAALLKGGFSSMVAPPPTRMENQRVDFEREMETRLKGARDEVMQLARSETEMLQDASIKQINKLMEEKAAIEKELIRERARAIRQETGTADTENLKRSEQRLKIEVARLKKEIERIHKTWERKFAILQQSLHALKDESFLRQTLQKQAAQLHQAAISYAVDSPLGIMPTKQPGSSKAPLPDISKHYTSSKHHNPNTHFMARNGGGPSNLYALHEDQVMSDNDEEDLPPGMVPLPPPPPTRSMSDCREDSRPRSSSDIVIVPSVTAQ